MEKDKWRFPYAAKLICGRNREGPGLIHGAYETLVNIHNPGEAQYYKYKLALAKAGADGSIHDFDETKETKVGADGAQSYGCRDIRRIYKLPDATLLDGFFVIESEKPLDVIAMYTTNDLNGNGAPAIDVHRVFERTK
jgi:hypothetical protein